MLEQQVRDGVRGDGNQIGTIKKPPAKESVRLGESGFMAALFKDVLAFSLVSPWTARALGGAAR